MDRREFFRRMAQLSGGVAATTGLPGCDRQERPDPDPPQEPDQEEPSATVAFVSTTDRAHGVDQAVDLLEHDFAGKHCFIKPNFNSADPPPGSTHNLVLQAIVQHCQEQRCEQITVGDRSGMADTREVMEQKQIFTMSNEFDFDTVVFDELDADGWQIIDEEHHHWPRGFALPRPVLDADAYIQTCCLKTHRFGGHFTLALKNNVGLVPRILPDDTYNYMSVLHDSEHQRAMIAEVNDVISHDLIVLDAVEGFYEEGPDQGPIAEFGAVIAGTDPVAIDAIGVALLRHHGTTDEVESGPIFELEQIARAIELGIGTADRDSIEILAPDEESSEFADEVMAFLD